MYPAYCRFVEDADAFSTLTRMSRAKKEAAAAFLTMIMHVDNNPTENKRAHRESLCLNANLLELVPEEAIELINEIGDGPYAADRLL